MDFCYIYERNRTRPMPRKKPASFTNTEHPLAAACPRCEALERRYDNVIAQIRELLDRRFPSPKEKVRDLHRWQEYRDEAIEELYEHKRMHRIDLLNTQGRKIA